MEGREKIGGGGRIKEEERREEEEEKEEEEEGGRLRALKSPPPKKKWMVFLPTEHLCKSICFMLGGMGLFTYREPRS